MIGTIPSKFNIDNSTFYMRAVVQRVSKAKVKINHNIQGEIQKGLVVLLGIEEADTTEDINWLTNKIVNLRIFPDEEGNMNKSIHEIDGSLLLISQFTLHAKIKKGKRPSFIKAAKPEIAIPLYNQTLETFDSLMNRKTETGIFGAMMNVELTNWGPVTLIIDTKNKE